MGQTPEGKVKEAVKKELKKRGIWYYMPVQNGMGVVGIPDIIGCWHGWFIAIETKAPGKVHKVTANQRNRLREIHEHGGLAIVCDNVESLRTVLDNLQNAREALKNADEEESRIITLN